MVKVSLTPWITQIDVLVGRAAAWGSPWRVSGQKIAVAVTKWPQVLCRCWWSCWPRTATECRPSSPYRKRKVSTVAYRSAALCVTSCKTIACLTQRWFAVADVNRAMRCRNWRNCQRLTANDLGKDSQMIPARRITLAKHQVYFRSKGSLTILILLITLLSCGTYSIWCGHNLQTSVESYIIRTFSGSRTQASKAYGWVDMD